MRWFLFLLCLLPGCLSGQSAFSFSGYAAGQTWTNNSYQHTNTQNGYTLSTRVTQTANPGWMNLTGSNSPNYATYAPAGCSSVTGLFLATDRTSASPVVSADLNFSPAVCGPVTFRIYDINGEDVNVSLGYGFRDDVTITAYDQNNSQIPLATSMVINNGSGNCGGGSYGANYVHTSGNALKVVGCTYDNCYWDYFTISSASKMISRIVIDYASGNKDWGGTTISNPNRQWIIIADVRAWTPTMNITQNCGSNPVVLTGSLTSAFPPSSSSWGIPNASYPAVPAANQPSAPTYSWSGTEGTFSAPNSLVTQVSGLSSAGATLTLTGQNNRGCVATRNLGLTIANCSVLPVELVSFNGRCENDSRIFRWSTASEFNNDHFTLEQSEDAIHFMAVGNIQGAGNSREQQYYEYVAGLGGGNYFRLKQVDGDGTFSYSRIISLPCLPAEGFTVYPNPAMSMFTVQGDQLNGKPIKIVLRDITGRVMLEEYSDGKSTGSGWVLDMSALAPGVYHAEFRDKNDRVLVGNKKIIKL